MNPQELALINESELKVKLIEAFIDVIKTTCPALAVVFKKYLLPPDSESSQKLQAILQIETFAELLTLWIEGIAEEQLVQALPYFLEILKHHLTEKGSDDLFQFAEDGTIPLEESIRNYNEIAGDLAGGKITLKDAISKARKLVVTPDLQDLDTDIAELFGKLRGKPTLHRRLGIRLFDIRHSLTIRRRQGEMTLRRALKDPNTFILIANLRAIDRARKSVLELDQKTDGKLKGIVEYTLQMLVERYSGGNELLEDVHTPVEKALEIGKKTVLIGFTYGKGVLARASADPEFLEAIQGQQAELTESMTLAAGIIREMNDASPTALTVWGERREEALEELEWLRQEIGYELNPKEFFIKLRECAKTNPGFQRYVDFYARQVVDAGQNEYNIGLYAAENPELENTWDSFVYNMDFLAPDYAKSRKELGELLSNFDPRAADHIGKMIGYHDGLYRFAKGDFDAKRDFMHLAMLSAQNWQQGLSSNKAEQLAVFENFYAGAVDSGQDEKAALMLGLLQSLKTNYLLE